MGSDRARNTFDRVKQYRRVVAQQGRVELEADKNESAEIATEALRLETIDIVGPYGVPSTVVGDQPGDGYKIGLANVLVTEMLATASANPGAPDLSIGAGTFYLGGWRLEQEVDGLTYYGQSSQDWVDGPEPFTLVSSNEVVFLHVFEQEISAAEDGTLREVALGGPDTAQRTRLTRHVRRRNVDGKGCGAFGEVAKSFDGLGFDYHPESCQLVSRSTLKVTPEAVPPNTNPCDPVAKGGYLGAENQMIRVQIARPNAETEAPQFFWAYDDASDLYPVAKPDPNHKRTLKLGTVPVDAYHWPKSGQWVEILVAATKLGDDGYGATPFGFIHQLAADYDRDGGTLTLNEDLEPEVFDAPAVYVRVWENLQSFTPNQTTALLDKQNVDIGLQVTIAVTSVSLPHAGEYWCFAVRPGFPQQIFPARYTTPQPPDGPRQWICPLASIAWSENQPTISDCRPDFDDLVQLTAEMDEKGTGCCQIIVEPKDAPNLQSIVDSLKTTKGKVCFSRGTYQLTSPIVMTSDHAGITLEGIDPQVSVTLEIAQGSESQFSQGLVVLGNTFDIALRNLTFLVRAIPLAQLPDVQKAFGNAQGAPSAIGIGVRVVNGDNILVERCSFLVSGELAVGVFFGGETLVDVKDCRFSGRMLSTNAAKSNPVGILLASSTQFTLGANATITKPSLLLASYSGSLTGNTFQGLRACALIAADFEDAIRLEHNEVSQAYFGFLFAEETEIAAPAISEVGVLPAESADRLAAYYTLTGDPWLDQAFTVASVYPLPATSASSMKALSAPPNNATFQAVAEKAMKAAADKLMARIGTAPPGNVRTNLRVEESLGANRELVGSLLAARDAIPTPTATPELTKAKDIVLWAGKLAATVAADANNPVFHVHDNEINLASLQASTLHALAILDGSGSVTMTGNRMTNIVFNAPTVLLYAERAAVTGNLVVNYATLSLAREVQSLVLDRLSFDLQTNELAKIYGGLAGGNFVIARYSLIAISTNDAASHGTAVVSNVFEGKTHLPERPAGLPAWDQLNAEAP